MEANFDGEPRLREVDAVFSDRPQAPPAQVGDSEDAQPRRLMTMRATTQASPQITAEAVQYIGDLRYLLAEKALDLRGHPSAAEKLDREALRIETENIVDALLENLENPYEDDSFEYPQEVAERQLLRERFLAAAMGLARPAVRAKQEGYLPENLADLDTEHLSALLDHLLVTAGQESKVPITEAEAKAQEARVLEGRMPKLLKKLKGQRPAKAHVWGDDTSVHEALPEALDVLLRQSQRYKLLSPKEEIDLAKRIERGDLAAKERLINSNLRLVVHIARRYQITELKMDDITQCGMLGLIRASEKFDFRKGFRFSTYATIWIRQAIQRELDNTALPIRLPANQAQRLRNYQRFIRETEQELHYTPDAEEIAHCFDHDSEDVALALQTGEPHTSLQKTVGENSDTELQDLLPGSAGSAEEEAFAEMSDRDFDAYFEGLPEDDVKMFQLRHALVCAEAWSEQRLARYFQTDMAGVRRRLAAVERFVEGRVLLAGHRPTSTTLPS